MRDRSIIMVGATRVGKSTAIVTVAEENPSLYRLYLGFFEDEFESLGGDFTNTEVTHLGSELCKLNLLRRPTSSDEAAVQRHVLFLERMLEKLSNCSFDFVRKFFSQSITSRFQVGEDCSLQKLWQNYNDLMKTNELFLKKNKFLNIHDHKILYPTYPLFLEKTRDALTALDKYEYFLHDDGYHTLNQFFQKRRDVLLAPREIPYEIGDYYLAFLGLLIREFCKNSNLGGGPYLSVQMNDASNWFKLEMLNDFMELAQWGAKKGLVLRVCDHRLACYPSRIWKKFVVAIFKGCYDHEVEAVLNDAPLTSGEKENISEACKQLTPRRAFVFSPSKKPFAWTVPTVKVR